MITVKKIIEIYPEINFLNYVVKHLRPQVFVVGIFERESLFIQLSPLLGFIPRIGKIVTIRQWQSSGKSEIRVEIYNSDYIECIQQLAHSYDEDFRARKEALSKGFTQVDGGISCEITYSTKALSRKWK